MTTTPEPLENQVSRLEAALGKLAELSFSNAQRHDETLSRLEANANRHDEALLRLEKIMSDLGTQQQRTNRSLETLSQTQAECLQLIATNTVEINRIWQYLERQSGNGTSGHG